MKCFTHTFGVLVTGFCLLVTGGCQTYSEIAEKYLSEEKRRSLKSSSAPAAGPEEEDEASPVEEGEGSLFSPAPQSAAVPVSSSGGGESLSPQGSEAHQAGPKKSEAFSLPEIEDSLRKLRGDMEILNKKLEDSHKVLQTTLQALAQQVQALEQNQKNSTNKKLSGQEGEQALKNIFHQAEGFFKNKQWKSAIIYYERLREKTPKTHPLYKKSLLQIGFCFQQLNMHREGKVFLTELVQDFPQSSESLQARGLLSEASEAKPQKPSD